MNRADLVYAICHVLGIRPLARQDENPQMATERM
jgi:hypothetical protein